MQYVIRIAAVCFIVFGLTACERNEGPAEQAGKKIGQASEEAGQQLQDSIETAGEKIEEAGDAIREKTD